jgi:hypothetical protein
METIMRRKEEEREENCKKHIAEIGCGDFKRTPSAS